MTQTALASDLDLTKVAVGGLVDRMESAGFVERRADKRDARARRVFLTRAGQRMPRLVGVELGLEVLQLGRNLAGEEAVRAGLVCAVVGEGEGVAAAGFWFDIQPEFDRALRRLAAEVQAAILALSATDLLRLDYALERDGTVPAYLGRATGLEGLV